MEDLTWQGQEPLNGHAVGFPLCVPVSGLDQRICSISKVAFDAMMFDGDVRRLKRLQLKAASEHVMPAIGRFDQGCVALTHHAT